MVRNTSPSAVSAPPNHPAPAAGVGAEVEIRALALCPYAEITSTQPAAHSAAQYVSVGAAGVIARVPASGTDLQVGDEVWTRLEAVNTRATSVMTLPADRIFRVPVGLTLEQAATLGDSGLMALGALLEANILPNRRLLVHGAANPFGSAAIALATFLGAEVFATVESPAEVPIAEAAGAVRIAIARTRDEHRAVRGWAAARGFDVILDGALAEHIRINVDVLANGGQILTCPLIGRGGRTISCPLAPAEVFAYRYGRDDSRSGHRRPLPATGRRGGDPGRTGSRGHAPAARPRHWQPCPADGPRARA
jgi:NADPH:quinone reductase-like Zn-dependent oxidoreductase